MLTSWANHAALLAFGVGIGMLGRVVGLLLPASYAAAMQRERRPGEGRIEAVRHRVDEQNAILAEARTHSAALRQLNWIVPTLVAVLVATIALSPVELEWLWLLGGFAAGAILAELAVRLSRAGRLGIRWTDGLRPIRLTRGSAADGP
jgi:hypothetical protein